MSKDARRALVVQTNIIQLNGCREIENDFFFQDQKKITIFYLFSTPLVTMTSTKEEKIWSMKMLERHDMVKNTELVHFKSNIRKQIQLICRGGCAVGSFFVLAEQCRGRCVYVLFPVSCQLAWQLRADILDIETMRNNKSYDQKLLQQNLICFA